MPAFHQSRRNTKVASDVAARRTLHGVRHIRAEHTYIVKLLIRCDLVRKRCASGYQTEAPPQGIEAAARRRMCT